MYYLNFYFLVWVVMVALLFPFAILAGIAVVIENIQAYLEAQRNKDRLLQDIQYLISSLQKEDIDSDSVIEIVEGFKKYFTPFGEIAKESQEHKDRMEFLSALALSKGIEIDNVVKYREEFVSANPNHKKEIETAIGNALKSREANEKKK